MKRCRKCEQELGRGQRGGLCATCVRGQELLRETRDHLRGYPVPVELAKRFYRVALGMEDYRAFRDDLCDPNCTRVLGELGFWLQDTDESASSVEECVRELLPAVIGSATVHRLLMDLAYDRGDRHQGSIEGSLAHLLISRIGEANEGTRRDPYVVLDVQDEYFLLERQGRPSMERKLVELGDRFYDVHRCADGSRAWFDVTRQIDNHGQLQPIVLAG